MNARPVLFRKLFWNMKFCLQGKGTRCRLSNRSYIFSAFSLKVICYF